MKNQTAPLKVLFITSEIAPLVKTGGLGDVAAALPSALIKLNLDVRVLLPGYRQVKQAGIPTECVAEFGSYAGLPNARLLAGKLSNGLPILIVDCPTLFDRTGGPYQDDSGVDWPDNALRFGLLCKIGAQIAGRHTAMQWRPDVVHCNDWQAGLTPAYLRWVEDSRVPSVMTAHNLAFQGIFAPALISQLGLPAQSFTPEGLEYFGQISFIKAGLYYADHLTTVSPTYAEEIQTPELGFGMEGLLSTRRNELTGILNGIDTETWNPKKRYLNSATLRPGKPETEVRK